MSTAAVFARADRELTPRENSLTIYRFVSSDFQGAARFGVLQNELEKAALEEAPDLALSAGRMRVILAEEGAVLARMSGSGSAFFGLFERRAKAERATQALNKAGFRATLAKTLSLDRYRSSMVRAIGSRGR